MTVREFIDECRKRLLPLYGKEEAASLAYRALEDIFNISRTKQITYPDTEIENPEPVISRLESGEPIQYIAGFEYFCGEKFKVGPGVLIPRPETEELVNLICSQAKLRANGYPQPFKVFDICTGSGCIAWSLHKKLSETTSLESYGCDISEAALKYARNQRYLYGRRWPMFFRYDVIDGDFKALKSFLGNLDIIVSNPPYIAEKEKALMHKNVLDFEPEEALFVSDGDPLLFYRKIAEMAQELLYPGGKLYFEINPLFAEELKALLKEKNFSDIQISKDFSGKERFCYCSWKISRTI